MSHVFLSLWLVASIGFAAGESMSQTCAAGGDCQDQAADAEAASVSLLQFAYEMTTKTEPSAGSKILIIGDSNAGFAGGGPMSPGGPTSLNTLQKACAGSTVVNQGDPGTKVSAWMNNEAKYLKDTFAKVGGGWTHVWVSLGGNDLGEDFGCGRTSPAKGKVKAKLTGLISEIKKLTTAQVVLTAYAVSAIDDTCTLEEMRSQVTAAMKEIAAADPKVTFASIETAAGGLMDPTARASKKCFNGLIRGDTTDPKLKALMGVAPCRGNKALFYPDGVHLNQAGYAAAFGLPAVQTAFACLPPGTPTRPPPPTVPPPPCKPDDNAAITAYAATFSYTLGGCAEASAFCNDPTHGGKVKQHCQTSCKVGGCK